MAFEAPSYQFPAGRRCPRCGAILASDNEGPRCSPCERVILTAEILRAIAAADAAPAPVVRPHTPIGVQTDTLLRVLAGGPQTTLELDAALHFSGASRAARYKQLRRVIAAAQLRGYTVTHPTRGRGGCYRLRSLKPTTTRSTP